MSETRFRTVDYRIDGLIGDIARGRIGLPDIQRPFVWPNAKIRDLFDSIYKGYPVGYLLFWTMGSSPVTEPSARIRNNLNPALLSLMGNND